MKYWKKRVRTNRGPAKGPRCLLWGILFWLLAAAMPLAGEETATAFFNKVSTVYASIQDYEAEVTITQDEITEGGRLSYRAPNFLRIDYSFPSQKIKKIVNLRGRELSIYLPKQKAILTQKLKAERLFSLGGATAGGLALLKRRYSVGYQTGPNPVRLEKGLPHRVIKLRFLWRSTLVGFRRLILSVDSESLLIRRIEGISVSGKKMQMDFKNFHINRGIPEERFVFTPPPEGRKITNFLFNEED